MYSQSLYLTLKYIRHDKALAAMVLLGSFILQVVLGQLESLPSLRSSELLIFVKLLFSIFHIFIFLILLRRMKSFHSGKFTFLKTAIGEALTSAPSFILFSIFYIILVLAGLFLMVVPGIYLMGAAFFLPFFAALDIETKDTFLAESRKLSHQHFPFVWTLSFFSLVMEIGLELNDMVTQYSSPLLMWIFTLLVIGVSMILFLWGGTLTLELKGKNQST